MSTASRTPRGKVSHDFSLLKKVECAGCGKGPDDTKLMKLPGAYTRSWGCSACILKFGTDVLSGEIDRLIDLAVGSKAKSIPCGRGCGRSVTRNADGKFFAWCDACEKERMRVLHG